MKTIARQGKRVAGYQPNPGSEWIEKNRSSLPNNQWVAANGTGLIDSAATMDGLMEKIHTRQIDPARVVIAFITTDSA
jgi:hypothetical protein